MGRWLASFSDLAGIIVIREGRRRLFQRIRREIRRVGLARFLDVLAYRAYSALFLSRKDAAWETGTLSNICARYAPIPETTQVLVTSSPNSDEARRFLAALQPDIVVARCKTLLRKEIFGISRLGTWVMHPGICPEYRNAYGCFWALANRDLQKVGMTLLRVDEHVDTGPVYGYYTCAFDEVNDTPSIIHQRVVLDNLDQLRAKLIDICENRAFPIDTTGRPSATWGQPWLTRYLKWKWAAKRAAA